MSPRPIEYPDSHNYARFGTFSPRVDSPTSSLYETGYGPPPRSDIKGSPGISGVLRTVSISNNSIHSPRVVDDLHFEESEGHHLPSNATLGHRPTLRQYEERLEYDEEELYFIAFYKVVRRPKLPWADIRELFHERFHPGQRRRRYSPGMTSQYSERSIQALECRYYRIQKQWRIGPWRGGGEGRSLVDDNHDRTTVISRGLESGFLHELLDWSG